MISNLMMIKVLNTKMISNLMITINLIIQVFIYTISFEFYCPTFLVFVFSTLTYDFCLKSEFSSSNYSSFFNDSNLSFNLSFVAIDIPSEALRTFPLNSCFPFTCSTAFSNKHHS